MTKTLLTIAAGPGMSLSTARRFAADGYRVVLAARDPQALRERLAATGPVDFEFDTVDASNPQDVAALVARHAGQLTALHYNAGVLHYDAGGSLQARRLQDETVSSLISDLHANVTGALAAIGPAAEAIEKNGGGSILLTGGGFGIEPTPDFLSLSVGKAALRAAAKALFEPMKARGVHIAMVSVSTLVSPDSRQAEDVARAFWHLHAQPREAWTWETVYAG
ncbi:SDR family NAD(P)-dependent oxidoreductase [Roseateles sp.]|uniref:SDR family NAD(P)-dependent oxidoreductase n=1 Tax=Roseateles sp. TaxID=1971397 RepID=UPI002F419330